MVRRYSTAPPHHPLGFTHRLLLASNCVAEPGSISGVAPNRGSFRGTTPSLIGNVRSPFDEGDQLLVHPVLEGRAHAVRGALVDRERRVLDQLRRQQR